MYLSRERELRRSVRGVPSWQRCARRGSERLASMNIIIIIIIIVINIISIIIIMLAEVYWRRYCDPIWCDGEFVNIITGIIKTRNSEEKKMICFYCGSEDLGSSGADPD